MQHGKIWRKCAMLQKLFKRYTLEWVDSFLVEGLEFVEDPDGEFIKYEDAMEEINKLNKTIQLLRLSVR